MLNFKKTSCWRNNYMITSSLSLLLKSPLFNEINLILSLSLHHRGSSRVSPLQFLSLYFCSLWHGVQARINLGDPGAESGGEGKSKRVEKYDTKKSKKRREEPLGTMSYQTSSKR